MKIICETCGKTYRDYDDYEDFDCCGGGGGVAEIETYIDG